MAIFSLTWANSGLLRCSIDAAGGKVAPDESARAPDHHRV
jgi:hypothetical protein